MQLTMTCVGQRPATIALCSRRTAMPIRTFRYLSIRCDSDDDIVPIFSGKKKKAFTDKEYEMLKNPKLLGGATIGDELSLIQKRYRTAEEFAEKQVKKASSANWDGDVYIGGRWNELSVLYLIFMLVPLLGLVFAWATHGTLWDTGVYY